VVVGIAGVASGLRDHAGACRQALGVAFSQRRHCTRRRGGGSAAAGRLVLFLRLLTVGLCVTALAGPRFANDRTETEASGVDIMLALDLSWSMMALDMGAPRERVSRI